MATPQVTARAIVARHVADSQRRAGLARLHREITVRHRTEQRRLQGLRLLNRASAASSRRKLNCLSALANPGLS